MINNNHKIALNAAIRYMGDGSEDQQMHAFYLQQLADILVQAGTEQAKISFEQQGAAPITLG